VIEFVKGDILDSGSDALVNTVNCVGIMGRGIALQFKERYPDNFKSYKKACDNKLLQPGYMFVYETGYLTNPKYIINFPTKRHWRGKSRIEDIENGLNDLVKVIKERNVRSVSVPPLGSGLGGLDWNIVRSRIQDVLGNFDGVRFLVYEPNGKSEDLKTNNKTAIVPVMTPGRAALIVLMYRYLRGLMDPFITLLEVHKLLYFIQEAGQPLKLHYTKAPYGPYAENLRHVLKAIEGYFVSGYKDGEDAPDKQLVLVPGAVKDAESFLKDDNDTRGRFDKVAELVEGFETPFGLELLSTVHWVVTREKTTDIDDVVSMTYAWNARKKRFSKQHIELALKVLGTKGWLMDVGKKEFIPS